MKAKASVLMILLLCLSAFAQNSQPSPKAEERIQKEVRHQILLLPHLNVFDNIEFQVNAYEVTLLGQVTRPVVKSDAERAVKSIEGVEKVNNQIEVLPTSPSDDRLRAALFRAIYQFPSLQRYALPVIQPIRIIVRNGRVTLEGVVDSEADKNTAGIRANTVPGIFEVKNNLRVAN